MYIREGAYDKNIRGDIAPCRCIVLRSRSRQVVDDISENRVAFGIDRTRLLHISRQVTIPQMKLRESLRNDHLDGLAFHEIIFSQRNRRKINRIKKGSRKRSLQRLADFRNAIAEKTHLAIIEKDILRNRRLILRNSLRLSFIQMDKISIKNVRLYQCRILRDTISIIGSIDHNGIAISTFLEYILVKATDNMHIVFLSLSHHHLRTEQEPCDQNRKAVLFHLLYTIGLLASYNKSSPRATSTHDEDSYLIILLELCVLWCTWERNHVADVLHTGYEENQALETEAETCVRA